MGNISEAFGKVTISAPTLSDIEVLVATHRVINAKAWTPTTLEGYPSKVDSITTEEGLVSVTLLFSAYGNWNIRENVDSFLPNILKQDSTLSDIPMSATFDYVDAESGVNFIYKASVRTRNVPGKGVTTELLVDEDLGDYSETYLKELEEAYEKELTLVRLSI
ncbi:hypothetical protein I6I02_07220 [Streptococcus salivarius]|uniref:hypothetical protein n=1 Tax=Streptococcus salivarius TaxID=1304 RepID=UPI0018E180C9|nr:hypothetical protein [Streptococcus salivarius]QQB69461.1 hypothetical protein I6I02_07220 [Streptococcus salivarius]